MDGGGNQNYTKTVNYPQKAETDKKAFKGKQGGESSENNQQINKPSSKKTKGKTKPISNKFKDKPKEEKPENECALGDPKKKPQKNIAATSRNKTNGITAEFSKNLTVMKKPQKKDKFTNFNKLREKRQLLQTENINVLDRLSCDTFEFEDIIENPNVLELIQDLVNCFTCNSTLPENLLQTLKISLIERTCFVILNILNNCLKKTCTKVLSSNFFQEIQKKPTVNKKDACCQTCTCLLEDEKNVS